MQGNRRERVDVREFALQGVEQQLRKGRHAGKLPPELDRLDDGVDGKIVDERSTRFDERRRPRLAGFTDDAVRLPRVQGLSAAVTGSVVPRQDAQASTADAAAVGVQMTDRTEPADLTPPEFSRQVTEPSHGAGSLHAGRGQISLRKRPFCQQSLFDSML